MFFISDIQGVISDIQNVLNVAVKLKFMLYLQKKNVRMCCFQKMSLFLQNNNLKIQYRIKVRKIIRIITNAGKTKIRCGFAKRTTISNDYVTYEIWYPVNSNYGCRNKVENWLCGLTNGMWMCVRV